MSLLSGNALLRARAALVSAALLAAPACGDEVATQPGSPDVAATVDAEDAPSPADDVAPAPDASEDVEPPPEVSPDALGEDGLEDGLIDVGGDPARALCEATGGAFEAGVCDCRQTPEATALEASFDPELGCVPDARRLCADTGGLWEGDACACAQDGVTLHHEFDRKAGCGFPGDAGLTADILSKNVLDLIAGYASDAQRVWLVESAGVFHAVHALDGRDALLARLTPSLADASNEAGACIGEPFRDVLPEVACEADAGMAPTGCFLVTTRGDFDRVSRLMKAGVAYDFQSWSPEEIARAEADEQRILKVHVASTHRVTLAFRRLAGAWVLVVVDIARYGCSA
jgi:hypothetical protein